MRAVSCVHIGRIRGIERVGKDWWLTFLPWLPICIGKWHWVGLGKVDTRDRQQGHAPNQDFPAIKQFHCALLA